MIFFCLVLIKFHVLFSLNIACLMLQAVWTKHSIWGIQFTHFMPMVAFCTPLLKVNNRNTRNKTEICSELIIKTPERHYWCLSGVFIVNFEHISYLVILFLLLTLSMSLPAAKQDTFDHFWTDTWLAFYHLYRFIWLNYVVKN